MDTSKLQLHIEQLSLRMPWRLAEPLFYSQCYKKEPHGVLQEGRKRDLVRTCTLSRWPRRGGGHHRLGNPPWGGRSLSHILGTPALESNTGKINHLSWAWMWALGKEWNQFSSAAPAPPALTQPLRGTHQGKSGTSSEVVLQPLGPQSHPQPRHTLLSHLLSHQAQLPQGSCSSPSGPSIATHRAVTATEPRRNPGLQWLWL